MKRSSPVNVNPTSRLVRTPPGWRAPPGRCRPASLRSARRATPSRPASGRSRSRPASPEPRLAPWPGRRRRPRRCRLRPAIDRSGAAARRATPEPAGTPGQAQRQLGEDVEARRRGDRLHVVDGEVDRRHGGHRRGQPPGGQDTDGRVRPGLGTASDRQGRCGRARRPGTPRGWPDHCRRRRPTPRPRAAPCARPTGPAASSCRSRVARRRARPGPRRCPAAGRAARREARCPPGRRGAALLTGPG